MKVPGIDIYLTYRCDIRCKHCFVGDKLNTSASMPWLLVREILGRAQSQWSTEEISFLGGEPSLYPHIRAAISLAQEKGYRVRVVTNGGTAAARLMREDWQSTLHFAFSLDGSTAAEHDRIRRQGSFGRVLRGIEAAHVKGHSTSIIVSVGKHNLADALATLRVADQLCVDYINVHYVTNRGFASRDMVLDRDSWVSLRRAVKTSGLKSIVRFERTFFPAGLPLNCRAADDSMLMFFPDGRVFTCSMYLHEVDGNAYKWLGGELVRNNGFDIRHGISIVGSKHCPAMYSVNQDVINQAEASQFRVGCIFDKEETTSSN